MEEQTAEELIQDLMRRLSEVEQMLSAPDNSALKEKRQFATSMLPIVDLAYYGIYADTQGSEWIGSPGNCSVAKHVVVLLSRSLERYEHQLPCKPSLRSKAEGEKWVNLNEAIRRLVRDCQIGSRIVKMRELFSVSGRSLEFASATCCSVKENIYVQDLLYLLHEEGIPTLERWSDLRRRWPLKVTAKLSVRFYINRLERRAFCSDHDELRALVGSALHSLLKHHHRNDTHRPYATTMPCRNKNILSEDFKMDVDQEFTLLLGDISSFTASFANTWLLLIEVTSMLETEGRSDEILILDVRGELIETSIVEILRLVIYMCSAVEVEHEGERFFSLGAMLGIAGIDTLAKVLFGLILEELCDSLPRGVEAIPKAGGDDFVIKLRTKVSDHQTRKISITFLEREISKYVGKLKTFDEIRIASPPCDFLTTATYCKKILHVRSELLGNEVRVQIQSQYKIPLFRGLIQGFDEDDDSAVFLSFWTAIRRTMPWVEEREELCDMIFALVTNHHFTLPSSKYEKYSIFGVIGSGLVTDKVKEMLAGVPVLYDSRGTAFRSTDEQRMSSLNPSHIKVLTLLRDEKLVNITIHRSELVVQSQSQAQLVLPRRHTAPHQGLIRCFERLRQKIEELALEC
jgi:hypothetical protein